MKMLLALDPFGHSLKATEEALRLVKLQACELTIVVIAETFQDAEDSYVGMEGGKDALVPLVKQKAEEAEKIAMQEGITPKIVVKVGESPAEGILKCAEEEKAELIVMGHRERKGLDRFLLGSVATKVVNNAHCSVLVVR